MIESVRTNWKILIEPLQKLDKCLNPPPKQRWLPNHISDAQHQVNAVLEIVQAQSLYVIGSVNINKKLLFILNRLEGISYGLDDGMGQNRALQLLAETKQGLTDMLAETSVKLDKQLLDNIVQRSKIKAADINKDDFDNLTDAMQSVVRKFGNADSVSDIDKGSSRDIINISKIMERNTKDLRSMKSAINKAKTDPDDNENFILMQGPVLTGANLDLNKLKASGMDYDTVYFPGIKYGFSRKEETPRYYILRDQLLVAVLLGQVPRKKFQLKLKNTPLEKKIAQDNKSFKNISTDIPQILGEKLGYKLVHVGAEREAYITNKQFPGIRFMWMMKRTQYDRIGPFSSSYILQLPF